MIQDLPFTLLADDAFSPVIDQFRRNFENDGELAASFCVYQGNTCLVSLYGGWADRQKTIPFAQKNLVSVFSTGKTAAALVIAWLAEQDYLGYDQEVGSFWPEFDTHCKGALTIAQILSHQHGLPGITDPNWTPEDWYDWDKTCATLAAQKPLWEPGTASGYSPQTYGFLAGEIARRVDPERRTLGQILREEICEPGSLDIWIGLAESEHDRCAHMKKPTSMAKFGDINSATRTAFLQKSSSPGGRSISDWRKAEFPGSNCHANADSLARLLQLPLTGKLGTVSLLSEDVLSQIHSTRISGQNLVLPFELNVAAGFMKNAPNFYYGPNPDTIGHSGWGGSCVFADPKTGLSGAYVMTKQQNSLMGDPRAVSLIDALYDSYGIEPL